MELRNRTPLPAALHVGLDRHAAEWLVVCVKGTWALSERHAPSLAEEQDPLHPADVHHGEPGVSSIRYEGDLGPVKVATDCVLVGSARPTKPEATHHDVEFKVATRALKARLLGARRGGGPLGLLQGSDPVGRLPLRWEYAVGGTDFTPEDPARHSMDPRNPLGRGFRARGSKRPRDEDAPPQIVRPGKEGEPVGFGFIGTHWKARQPYAGTYDKAWQQERCPLLPDDFDERFHNAAPPELVQPGILRGGERVEVIGCTSRGKLAFALPVVTLHAEAVVDGPPEPMKMKLVTVTVDTDRMLLFLSYRGQVRIHRRLPLLKVVTLDAEGLGHE